MGFGVLIVRLRYLQSPLLPHTGNAWKLGLMFAFTGLLTVLISTLHYISIRYAIDQDTYEPASRWVLLLSLTVLILGAGVIYFLLTTSLTKA
jgi:putative membrane protein